LLPAHNNFYDCGVGDEAAYGRLYRLLYDHDPPTALRPEDKWRLENRLRAMETAEEARLRAQVGMEPQTERLSDEARWRLAFVWLDRCVRLRLPVILERAGLLEQARAFRAHVPLSDQSVVSQVERSITELARAYRRAWKPESTEGDPQLASAIFLILGLLTPATPPDLDLLRTGCITLAGMAGVADEERGLAEEETERFRSH
jgi:hypothetical protein